MYRVIAGEASLTARRERLESGSSEDLSLWYHNDDV